MHSAGHSLQHVSVSTLLNPEEPPHVDGDSSSEPFGHAWYQLQFPKAASHLNPSVKAP